MDIYIELWDEDPKPGDEDRIRWSHLWQAVFLELQFVRRRWHFWHQQQQCPTMRGRPAMGTRLGGHWVTHQAIISLSDATDFLFGMPEFVPPEIFWNINWVVTRGLISPDHRGHVE